MGRADRHFLLDFTRAAQADEGAVALDDGDVEYQLRGRGQTRPDLVTLRWTPRLRERLQELRAHTEGGVGEAAARLGKTLADFLDAPAWTRAADALASPDGGDAWLTVRSNAAELYLLPWELVSVGEVPHAGSLSRLLIRYEWPDTRTAPRLDGPSRTRRGRVVFAWSAAGGKVQASAHVALIEKAAQASRACFDDPAAPALDEVKGASVASLGAALARAKSEGEHVAVLHLLCHGSEREGSFGLALDGEDGAAVDVVNAGRLAMALRDHAGLVRLVVVSACDSGNAGEVGQQLGSVAQELHKAGFGAVIASRLPLSWDGARLFAAALYEGILGALVPLEEAFLAARGRLLGRASYDWASLQLYARASDGDATHVFQARPYRGLAAYGPEHARFFFGRSREIAEVVDDLDALAAKGRPRLLVVSGASGTGKSSMVLGGAIPLWKSRAPEGGFASLVVRPGERPSAALAEVEARLAIVGGVCRRLLVVVDQFEEVFTHDAREEAAALVRALWRLAVEPDSPVCVLVTLRIDFLGRCSELVLDDAGLRFDKVACDPAHQVLVAQMSPEQLREAVERPALAAGLALEPGLADDVVRDVEAAPGALPLMSHALYLLWKRRGGDVLTRADYRALGAVQGALDAHAEQVHDALADDAARALMRRLMLALVHAGAAGASDTRRRRAVDELRARFAAEGARFEAVLARMVDARLLVTGGDDAGGLTVEVAHEALLRSWKRFKAWIDEDRATLVQLAQLDAWAREWRERPDALLHGSRLAVAEEAERTHGGDLGDDARALLAASRAVRARAQAEAARALRLRRAGVAAAFAVMTGVALGGVVLWRRAEAARTSAVRAADEALRARREAQISEARSRASELRTRAEAPDLELENLIDALLLRADVGTRLGARLTEADGALLQTATAAILRPPLGSEDWRPEAVAFSPTGDRAAASMGARLWLWDTADGGLVATLQGRSQGAVRPPAPRFTPDGSRLVAHFLNKTSRAWGARDGTPEVALGEGQSIGDAGDGYVDASGALSSDGWLARFERVVRFTRDGRVLATLPEGTPRVLDLRFEPEAGRVLAALADGTVRRWDAARGAFDPEATTLLRRGEWAEGALSPDGARLVAQESGGGPLRVWELREGHRVAALDGAERLPRFTPDGRHLLSEDPLILHRSSGEAGSLAYGTLGTTIWDAASGRVVRAGRLGFVRDVADDGERTLSIGEGGRAAFVADMPGAALVTARVQGATIEGAAFAPRGVTLLVRPAGRSLHLWNEGDGALVLTLGGRRAPLGAVAFSRDGGVVVTAGARGAALWDARDGRPGATTRGDAGAATVFDLSPDGTRVVVLHEDHMARLWDAATGALRGSLGRWGPDGEHTSDAAPAPHRDQCLFSPDGARILTSALTGDLLSGGPLDPYEVRLWSAEGDPQRALRVPEHGGVVEAWFSPDSARVLTAHVDGSARLWDAASGATVADLPAVGGDLYTAAFVAGGAHILAVYGQGELVTWDARTGARLRAASLHTPLVGGVLSADGARLFGATAAGVDTLWDAASGRRVATLQRAVGASTRAAFSPDGARLATAYDDGAFTLWDGRGGALVATVAAHLAPVGALAFSPNGARLATASGDGVARVWALDPAAVTRAACAALRRRPHWRERPALRAACGEPR